jgi:Tfp pilus assembly protein PilN
MRAVNLLPADAYAPKQRLPYAPIVLAATAPVLAGALVYLGYSVEHSKVTDRRIALNVVQSQVAALSPSTAYLAQVNHIASERAQRLTELSDALGKQVSWDVTFDQISRVLPQNAWVTTLIVQSPTTISGATPSTTTFTLQGYTYKQADVAKVLARLALVPALSNVTLASSTATVLGISTKVVQFSITGTIVGVPA